MWLLTNIHTKEELLFSSVEAWQSYANYNNWHEYSIRFINKG